MIIADQFRFSLAAKFSLHKIEFNTVGPALGMIDTWANEFAISCSTLVELPTRCLSFPPPPLSHFKTTLSAFQLFLTPRLFCLRPDFCLFSSWYWHIYISNRRGPGKGRGGADRRGGAGLGWERVRALATTIPLSSRDRKLLWSWKKGSNGWPTPDRLKWEITKQMNSKSHN